MQFSATKLSAALATSALLLALSGIARGDDDGFTPLFDGKSLDGWRGEANVWKVEEGAIVGRAFDDRRRPTYLIHDGTYKNFVLKLKFKLAGANSGVQIRGRVVKELGEYFVAGYSADVVAADFMGCVFEEQGRGLVSPSIDPKAVRAAYKFNEWNDYEVVANGPQIKIALNGLTTTFYEERDPARDVREGVIALQLLLESDSRIFFKDVRVKETRLAAMLRK